jgi:hypothetical protein
MKLNATTLIIGVAALLYVGVAQSQSAIAATTPCPYGVGGPLSVYILDKNFKPSLSYNASPTPSNPTYTSPTSSTTLASGTAMTTDVNQAFAVAPQFFKQRLCNLDGVFINTNDCSNFDPSADVCSGPVTPTQITEDSWGYREGPWQFAPLTPGAPPPQYGRYVAISAGPWSQSGSHAPSYSGYEQMLLRQLLPWSANPPAYQPANASADTPGMAVLAALAHELGHVLWYDTFRPTAGGSYDFNSFCHGTFFMNSWRHVDAPPLWRSFGTIQNSHHPAAVAVQDIVIALLHQNFQSAGDLLQGNNQLQGIYATNGRWASLFAAFSPDEDFVETFKFYVLINAVGTALTSLPIDIYGYAHKTLNIPYDYSNRAKTELTRKVACMQETFH